MYILKQHDTFTLNKNTTIEIYCPARAKGIQAIIPKDIQFKAHSNWESAFGALKDNQYFATADLISQFLGGVSINQPFLARKMWKGSEPFQLKIQIAFVAQTDAEVEVMQQVETLMGFTLPRKMEGGKANKGKATDGFFYVIPGPNPLLGTALSQANAQRVSANAGDFVNIRIGSYLTRVQCYIEDVAVKLSSVLDPTGNPQYALCDTTISCMDAMYEGTNVLKTNTKASGAPIQGH
jgi:hypothetical protein